MIRFSAFLVVVAIGLLVAGVTTSRLLLVYVAIAVSVFALIALAVGAFMKRRELFGDSQQFDVGGRPTGERDYAGSGDVVMVGRGVPQVDAEPGGYGTAGGPRGRWTEPGSDWDGPRSRGADPPGFTAVMPAVDDNPESGVDDAVGRRDPAPGESRGQPQTSTPATDAGSWRDVATKPAAAPPATATPAATGQDRPAGTDAGAQPDAADGDGHGEVTETGDTAKDAGGGQRDEPPGEAAGSAGRGTGDTGAVEQAAAATSNQRTATADQHPAWDASSSAGGGSALKSRDGGIGQAQTQRPSAGPTTRGSSDPPEGAGTDRAATAQRTDPDEEHVAGQDDGDTSAATDTPGDGNVTVVPGVPRYHNRDCILIRFMREDDLESMTRAAAKEAGCTPCRACQTTG